MGRSACGSCAPRSTSSKATGTSALDSSAEALGILGGTFNPPHLGHLALARQAREELRLDRVLLMPLNIPHHKPAPSEPGPAHRLAMCRLAVDGERDLCVSTLEIDRGGPSYTADSLRELHASHPEAQLTFIVGADTALTLPSWHEPEAVLSLARLAVAERPGSDRERVLDVVRALAPEHGEVSFLSMAPMPVSSSLARDRLRAGEPVEELLGRAVAGYVAEHRLYADGAAVSS